MVYSSDQLLNPLTSFLVKRHGVNELHKAFNMLVDTTVGGDPEFVLLSVYTGELINLHERQVGGTKGAPKSIEIDSSGLELTTFTYQVDNAAFEWNVPVLNLRSAANLPNGLVKTLHEGIKCVVGRARITSNPCYMIPREMLAIPEVMSFGCSKDLNVYLRDENPSPDPYVLDTLRFAGGHLTFSMPEKDKEDRWFEFIIRLLDLSLISEFFVGPNLDVQKAGSSIAGGYCHNTKSIADHAVSIGAVTPEQIDRWNEGINPMSCLETLRRQFYGMAGSFRITEFGIEYRTPSPGNWTSPARLERMFKGLRRAIQLQQFMKKCKYTNEDALDILNEVYVVQGESFDDVVPQIINDFNYPEAYLIINRMLYGTMVGTVAPDLYEIDFLEQHNV